MQRLQTWKSSISFHKTAEKQAFQLLGLAILKLVKILWPNLNHKFWKPGRSGNPSFFIPTLWNIGILLYKKAKILGILSPSVLTMYPVSPKVVKSLYIEKLSDTSWKNSLSNTYFDRLVHTQFCRKGDAKTCDTFVKSLYKS